MIISIRSNSGTTEDVLIPDMGLFIPAGGGQEDFETVDEFRSLQESTDLRRLTTEDFGNGSPSLIINDGFKDIAPGDVDKFLHSIPQLLSGNVVDAPDKASRDSTDENTIYVGRKLADTTAFSDAEWQIYRINISTPNDRLYADGNKLFDNVWTNRETLTYS